MVTNAGIGLWNLRIMRENGRFLGFCVACAARDLIIVRWKGLA
jgi:hypothetical protein